jgi:hypothetical protein
MFRHFMKHFGKQVQEVFFFNFGDSTNPLLLLMQSRQKTLRQQKPVRGSGSAKTTEQISMSGIHKLGTKGTPAD